MLENGGHWLKLMRNASQLADANICIRLSGPAISCRVIQRVTRGVELRVTCCIADQEPDSAPRPAVDGGELEQEEEAESSSNPGTREDGMLDSSTSPAFADGMVEAGNEERCEKETATAENSPHLELEKAECLVSPPIENSDDSWNMPFKDESGSKDILKPAAIDSASPHSEMSGASSERESPAAKAADRTYKCPLCTCICYSEQYLVKHVSMHDVRPTLAECDAPRDQSSFCEECNIHFLSSKTYQAHKEVYCKARHVMTQSEPSQAAYPRARDESDHATPAVEDVFVVGKNSLNGIPPVIQPQGFFAAISTNPLILLPCSLVTGQGFIPQNNIISAGAPIVLPGGITGSAVIESNGISLHPREKGSVILEQALNSLGKVKELKHSTALSNKYTTGDDDILDLKKPSVSDIKNQAVNHETPSSLQNAPLDLTVRKRKPSLVSFPGHHQVAKRRSSFATTPPTHLSATNSSSPEPSYPHVVGRVAISPPSFSNDASSSSGIGTIVPLSSLPVNGLSGICKIPDADSPGPPVLISSMEPQQPQTILPVGLASAKVLKQGNNRCEYCNIVFYKYDNYLAHKKHYCAYRRQQLSNAAESLSAMSDISNTDDNSNHGIQEHLSKKAILVDEKSIQLASRPNLEYTTENAVTSSLYISKPHSSVFRCDACGVKFSTADNLNAHQTYYCSRKLESSYSKYGNQCTKKSLKVREPVCNRGCESDSHDELCFPEEWKCNFCETVCPSLKAAKKHLLTHSEMRGFCCIVCGYRGNTLRGMRTHVYEHLNGNSSQIEDLLASSIVVDTGNPCHRAVEASDEESSTLQDSRLLVDESSKDVGHTAAHSCDGHERDALTERSASEDERKSPKAPHLSYGLRDSESSGRDLSSHRNSDSGDSMHSESVYSRTLNPGALCDVVIKTEEEDTTEKIVPERITLSPAASPTVVKDDPDSQEDEEIDVEKTDLEKENAKIKMGAVASVICKVSTQTMKSPFNVTNSEEQPELPRTNVVPKKRVRTQPKSELKYCKSCDISFHHLSNFIAHKKFYCVSRVIENFQQETAPVQ